MRKEVFLWQRSFALRVQMVHQSYIFCQIIATILLFMESVFSSLGFCLLRNITTFAARNEPRLLKALKMNHLFFHIFN